MQVPDDNNNNNQESPKPRFKAGYIYLIALGLILLLVYFAFNYSSGSTVSYTDADMMKAGQTLPDGTTTTAIDGQLYEILADEDVTKLNAEHHTSGGYYYLDGTYDKTVNGSKQSISFVAYLDVSNETAVNNYFTIINARTYNDNGNTIAYYGAEHGVYAFVDYTTQTSFMDYLPSIIIWGVIIILGIYLFSRLTKSMGSISNQQFTFNTSRARRETHSKVRFRDVAGCDEVKAELSEMVDYFHNARKYTRLGAKLPKGILLVGPPGTGKTLLAKAVAGEADVPFYSISGSDFVEMYVGVGAGRVRDMFRIAKQNAPCLIFIDEIDAVGRQRGAGLGGGNDEREQTLNQLLVEMDGFEDNSGVIVMAATNRADVLDPALLRAGRFDRTITVDLPDKEGRAAILRVHARNKIIAPSVDFTAIASRTVGFSGADLANILNDAAILAVRENKNAIDMDDIDEAIDRSIAGPAKTNRSMSEEEKKRVAYHEAGHAVIGIRLQHSEKVQRITIIPRGRTGGHVLMTPENDRYLLTKDELMAQITGLLGGRTSEEIFFGDISTGASNDIEQATNIARMMVTEYGMSDLGPIQYEKNSGSVFLGRDYTSAKANYSTQIAFEIDKAVRSIIDASHQQAKDLLLKYKADVELIAKVLVDRETITAEQIDYLLEHREMPPKPAETAASAAGGTPASGDTSDEPAEAGPTSTADEMADEKIAKADSPEALEFKRNLGIAGQQAALICLFAEDETGTAVTSRGARKIVSDSARSYMNHISGLGEEPSDKVRSCATMFIEKKLWSQFAGTSEEFGHYVEDYSRVEVVLVKVQPEAFAKLKQDAASRAYVPSALSSKAKKAVQDLKDLVNKSDDDDSKDDKK